MEEYAFLIELPALMFTALKINHVQQHKEEEDTLPY